VEITKNKKITTSIWLYLVIFTAIWFNFWTGPLDVLLWGESIREIENYGLKVTIHLSRKGGRFFLAAPGFPLYVKERRLSHAANVPYLNGDCKPFFAEKPGESRGNWHNTRAEPLRGTP
jgi:hypothetical protein